METIEHKEEFGKSVLPEGFEEILKDLPLEEQMNHFRTSSYRRLSNIGYSLRTLESGYNELKDDPDVQGIIVKNNMIVGIMIKDAWGRIVPCLPEERVCTYYASDNNGAGYKERIDYTWLLCVPADFEK